MTPKFHTLVNNQIIKVLDKSVTSISTPIPRNEIKRPTKAKKKKEKEKKKQYIYRFKNIKLEI